MKLIKSVLLGSAAGLCSFAVANAADLPNKKSAPVEYVRVCSEHGQGFFYVPGSDTCIRLGGRVRVDTMYAETNNRNYDTVNFTALARINLDVRSNTPYGMARAYLRYSLNRSDNNYGSTFNNNTTGVGNGGGLNRAYIQFAGLTAGRTLSFFDFYANENNYAALRSSEVVTQVLAYTANFGSGWSLTAGIEDGNERRIYNNASYSSPYGSGIINGVRSAGQSVPDAVSALRVDQSWGSAQLAAALHQVRPAFTSLTSSTNSYFGDTKYGFALHGGVKVNLPMIAAGDAFWLDATYADGAISYLGAGSYALRQGDISLPMTDAFIDANGRVKRNHGWSVVANFLHYWTPSVRQSVFASYMQLNYGRSGYNTSTYGGYSNVNTGFVDANELRVGTNLVWSPIKNFDIGAEVVYTRVDPKGRVISDKMTNGVYKTLSSDDAWQGRLRLQRDF